MAQRRATAAIQNSGRQKQHRKNREHLPALLFAEEQPDAGPEVAFEALRKREKARLSRAGR